MEEKFITELYDYNDVTKANICDYIKNNHDDFSELISIEEREKLERKLIEQLLESDDVTGNPSGAYFSSSEEAEDALRYNHNFLGDAMVYYNLDGHYLQENSVSKLDVLIRCYLVETRTDTVIDEIIIVALALAQERLHSYILNNFLVTECNGGYILDNEIVNTSNPDFVVDIVKKMPKEQWYSEYLENYFKICFCNASDSVEELEDNPETYSIPKKYHDNIVQSLESIAEENKKSTWIVAIKSTECSEIYLEKYFGSEKEAKNHLLMLSKQDIEVAEKAASNFEADSNDITNDLADIEEIKANGKIIKMNCENYFGYFNPDITIYYAMIRMDQIPDATEINKE